MFRKKIPGNKFVKLLTLSNIKASDHTLRKLCFHFLSNWIGYDRGDNFPFKFEPNGIPFDSKSKGKLSPLSYPIQCERKWKHSFLSVGKTVRQENRHRQLIAVRETGVSRHQGGTIEGPPETPRTSHHYHIEGIKGVPDLGKWKWKYSLFEYAVQVFHSS